MHLQQLLQKKVETDIVQSLNLQNPKILEQNCRDNLDIKCEPRIDNGKTQILNFWKSTKVYVGLFILLLEKKQNQ